MAVGAATVLGSFAARLGIDTNEYGKGILQAQGLNAAFGQTFANFVANPLLGSIDLFKKAGGAAIRLGVDVLGSAEEVQRLGQQTGATTELLQSLAQRMEVAGYNAEQGGKALLVLSRTMNEARTRGGPLADLFRDLGVNLDTVGGTDGALAGVLEGLEGIEDPATRSAIAMKLLGEESGPRLVNAVGGGAAALRKMVEEGRQTGAVLGTDVVNQLADFNTTLGYTGLALEGVKRNLTAQFLSGFIREFGTGTDGVLDLAGAVNEDLGPAMRRLGRDIGESAGDINKLTSDIRELIEAIKDFLYWAGQGADAVSDFIPAGNDSAFAQDYRRRQAQISAEQRVLLGQILDAGSSR